MQLERWRSACSARGNLRMPARLLLLLCALLSKSVEASPQQLPVFGGKWTATVGQDRTMRGRWIGQMLPGEPNSAHGSWTLTDKSGKTVMRGTWSARKLGDAWQGTWSAQSGAQRSAKGTWKADVAINPKDPLDSMMELQEASGTWQSGRLGGYWWLQGKPSTSHQ